MSKQMSITKLRSQIYSTIDQVVETGQPVLINRNGNLIKIVLDKKFDKLANLRKHKTIVGDADKLVNIKTSKWHETKNL
jgi:hypothetical protein